MASVRRARSLVFIVECTLKILAEGFGPWRYFVGPEWKWNNFDFIIVALCLPKVNFDYFPVALLRLARLMRIAKIIRKVPQLQMIVMGLVGGLKSIGYIFILLFLVFYLYSIMGIHDLIAADEREYVQLAVRAASDVAPGVVFNHLVS